MYMALYRKLLTNKEQGQEQEQDQQPVCPQASTSNHVRPSLTQQALPLNPEILLTLGPVSQPVQFLALAYTLPYPTLILIMLNLSPVPHLSP